MQEYVVTIAGQRYELPKTIFVLLATQNPIEQEGTYLLPEAQLWPLYVQHPVNLSFLLLREVNVVKKHNERWAENTEYDFNFWRYYRVSAPRA